MSLRYPLKWIKHSLFPPKAPHWLKTHPKSSEYLAKSVGSVSFFYVMYTLSKHGDEFFVGFIYSQPLVLIIF